MNLGSYRGKDARGIRRGKDVVGVRRKPMADFLCDDSIVQSVNSEAKDMENCLFTLPPLRQQLKLRIIVSANQLSLHGAVEEMCEKYESLHDRSGQLDVVMGQSIVLSEI